MTTHRIIFITVTLISSLALAVSSLQAAPPEGKGKSGNGKNKDSNAVNVDLGLSATISAGISIGDARILASNHRITGSKPLPPGIKKNRTQ